MNSCMSKASWEGMETFLQAGVTTGGLCLDYLFPVPWEWGSTWGSALEGAVDASKEVTTNIIKRELLLGTFGGPGVSAGERLSQQRGSCEESLQWALAPNEGPQDI